MADSLAQRRADGKKGITAVIDIAMEKLYPVAQEVKNEERELEKYGENRAILAVLLHHTDKILYQNFPVAMFSYCAVSFFIFLMGITTYWSFERNFGHLKAKLAQKVSSVFASYLVASAVYQLAVYRFFNLFGGG